MDRSPQDPVHFIIRPGIIRKGMSNNFPCQSHPDHEREVFFFHREPIGLPNFVTSHPGARLTLAYPAEPTLVLTQVFVRFIPKIIIIKKVFVKSAVRPLWAARPQNRARGCDIDDLPPSPHRSRPLLNILFLYLVILQAASPLDP